MNWKNDLNRILLGSVREIQSTQTLQEHKQEQIRLFFYLVREAFGEIKAEVEKHQRRVDIHTGKAVNALDIYNGRRMEFTYAVKVHSYVQTTIGGYNFYTANSFDPRDNVQRYNFAKIHTIDKERIIRDFMRAYQKQLRDGRG